MGKDGFYERNGEEIGFVISVGAGDQVRIDMAQAAAQQLRAIGINVTVDIPVKVDWAGQQAYLIGWGSPFDADDHTYKVFGTDKGANYSGYSDPLVDKYLTAARQSDDPEVRRENYNKFQPKVRTTASYPMVWQKIRHMPLSAMWMPTMWQSHQFMESVKRPSWDIMELVFSGM